jgi:hypothetical protein
MQGIAALPSGMAPEGAADQPAIGSLSAQEAATLGRLLTKVSQDEITQLRELSDDLKEFSLPELKDFLGGVDYIMQNAGNYKQSVRNLISRGIVEPGDLPADYVPTFYAILRQMIVTAMQGEEMGAEMPAFAKGGLVDMAKKVAKAGRHGDTMLAHITPREAAMLKQAGGAGTINPATGLVEYKSFWSKVGSFLKKAAPVILPVALSFIAPGLGTAVGSALGLSAAAGSAIVGAVGSGVGGLIAGQKPGQALLSAALGGIGSYALSSLAPGGLSGLFSGGATGAEGAAAAAEATGIGAGSGLEGAGEIVRGTQTAAPAGSVRPDIPVPLPRADVMSGAVSAPVSQAAVNADAAGVTGGLGNLFGGGVGSALKNPWIAAGLAGAAGLALGGSGKQGATAPTDLGPTGVQLLQQNPAQYGFNVANFQAQPVNAQIVPTGNAMMYGPRFAASGGHISGPGTGTSDDVPAMLSDGEFVLTAKAVRGAGNGSRHEGAKKLYKLMNDLEKRA